MIDRTFGWWSGLALSAAAVLLIGLNIILTPQLPRGSFDALAASDVFLIRQSLASAAAMLTVFGIFGLHAVRRPPTGAWAGAFAAIAFVAAMAGAVGLFAAEWNQLFTVRDFALHAPAALNAVEDQPGLTPFDIGALVTATGFFGGWLLLSASLFLSGEFPKSATGLVFAGFLAAPVLSAAHVAAPWAGIAASVIIGAGWFLLGLHLMRPRQP
jgi:hypothetical protein